MADRHLGHDRAARRLWPSLALPGTFWLIALFLVPFYAVMAVAFSGNINVFGEPIPAGLDRREAERRIHDAINRPVS